jgi:hypothetical protein
MKDTSGIAWTRPVLSLVGAPAAAWAAGEVQGSLLSALRFGQPSACGALGST